jgi:hypothetical protein
MANEMNVTYRELRKQRWHACDRKLSTAGIEIERLICLFTTNHPPIGSIHSYISLLANQFSQHPVAGVSLRDQNPE